MEERRGSQVYRGSRGESFHLTRTPEPQRNIPGRINPRAQASASAFACVEESLGRIGTALPPRKSFLRPMPIKTA